MACWALSLQPTNGPDILLQAREWFPPARAFSSFRQTRLSFSSGKNPNPISLDADPTSSLGDDPLAASSGQLVIGLESNYRVVYRLVNSIYVLAITTADLSNVFECIKTVNHQPRRPSRGSLGWRVLKGSMAGLSSAMRRRRCRKLLKGLTMPLAEAWMLQSLWDSEACEVTGAKWARAATIGSTCRDNSCIHWWCS